MQPHSVERRCYRIRMQPKDPKTYLWGRILRLLGLPSGSGVDAVFAKLKAAELSRGTIQRIKEGETSTGTDNLVKIAKHFDMEVWQLLTPDGASPAPKAGSSLEDYSAPPPPPPKDFSDNYHVTPEQWQLLQDVEMVMTKDEIRAIQERARKYLDAALIQIERQAAAAKTAKDK
ncbi:MAG TPA: hypothetical protein VMA55_10130 [Acidovorax sp.]|nr:hypothetical protein [Acidovorax sp.]